ncbi:MAG: peptide-methionine (S)-S-oxide reductase MsrA [Actinomycetaceae bacterium]|nr:peptide-methionine (S)-S-oxide reductase MsrA [Actinomycetaceae bacterium]
MEQTPTPATSDSIHPVLGQPLSGPWPQPHEVIYLGMGCFWGAERIMWNLPGVVNTAVGYAGGTTENPTYEQVCTGATGHAEVVQVVYDPTEVSAEDVLRRFWENHDPTQGDRQGNDIGPQYRSLVGCTTSAQYDTALALREAFNPAVRAAGKPDITTQILAPGELGPFWLAEDYHQAYLHYRPHGYCNLGPSGLTCPVGIGQVPED